MNKEDEGLAWLSRQKTEMISRLITLSEQNSGSFNLAGLHLTKALLKAQFHEVSDNISEIPLAPFEDVSLSGQQISQNLGDALVIKGPRSSNPKALKVLFTGHMDTVFSEDNPFQKTCWLDEEHLNGPGVADMKGGLLVILYALKAFQRHPLRHNISWTVFINSDEELGSLGSRFPLAKLAKEHQIGLVYEPSMSIDGTFAGTRKGSGKFSVCVRGKTAHAGREFHKGKNAICLMSEIVCALNALNHQRDGLTLNVGLTQGGHALNAVPELCVTKIDIRYESISEKEWVHEQIKKIITDFNQREGFHVLLFGDFSRMPKPMTEETQSLFSKIEAISQQLNLPFSVAASGGCCDGNNLQAEGLAVIDTLGVRGAHIHSDKEYMAVNSLSERASLSYKLLCRLAKEVDDV